MRVLVTGGAGYIGSQTARLLQASGHEPIVLDTLEHGHLAAVPGIRVVVGSVADEVLVRELLTAEGIQAVFHFAGLKAADESVRQPGRYFAANVGGSLALLSAAAATQVRWLVFSSSCAVYGEPSLVPVDEDAEIRPENPYGESKVLVERALPWFEPLGISYASLRYFNAAGADLDGSFGENPQSSSNLLPTTIRAALGQGAPLRIFGTDYPTPDGTAIRDYVHVVDLANAHLKALEHLVGGGPSFTLNLGTGRGASVREVVAAVERATRRTIQVLEAPRRPGDQSAVWADPRRAQRILGWMPRYDLEAIIESAVRWHTEHPDGYSTMAKPILTAARS
jgi:UDP-glucose-4-epimerase GalE